MTPRRGILLVAAGLALLGQPAPAPAAAPAPWTRTPPPAALPAAAPAPPRAREGKLPTGLRVVVVEHHRRPIVLVRLILPRGALLDPPKSAGASWLAMMLASDFYELSPTGEELVEEKPFRFQVVEMGGVPLFFVESDYSIVGISGYARDAQKYVEMIAQAVSRPRRGEDSFKGRRNALLDHIEDLETSDPQALWRSLAEASFGPGHPYARSLVGTRSTLSRLGMEDVILQQDRLLSPDGATLLIVGDVSAQKVFDAAKVAFGKWRRPAPRPTAIAPPVASTGKAEIDFLERKPASTLIACASRPLGDVQASDGALDLLATVLGGGMESRLAVALRERGGLTYSAGADIVRRRWARALLACSTLAADQAERGVRLLREALDGSATAPPTDEELHRAKAVRLAEIEAAWDDAQAISGTWIGAIARGWPRPRLAEERAEIERVTGDELRALARAVLRPGALRWIVSGEPRAASDAVVGNRMGRLRALSPDR